MKPLPVNFRKLSFADRRRMLAERLAEDSEHEERKEENFETPLEPALADKMVENCIGWFEIPLGIVVALPLDGRTVDIPLAVEEPSVIAAANYAARLMSRGEVRTWATDPWMIAQVWLELSDPSLSEDSSETSPTARFAACREELVALTKKRLVSMEGRGGGLRDFKFRLLDADDLRAGFGSGNLGVVEMTVDVRDALGANLLNSLAEEVSPYLEKALGGRKLLAILSNDGAQRLAGAEFRLPIEVLAKSEVSGKEAARRIVLAAAVADADPRRGVTHNKGIMNGVSSLAVATGNDSRAIEAAAHSWAAHSGRYRALSQYEVRGDFLVGRLEMPLPFATVGGTVAAHPRVRDSLRLLGNPDGRGLARIAAALGLAQNFAALYALTGDGIQKGHMALHRRRLEKTDIRGDLP